MDKVSGFQVAHGGCNLGGHVHENDLGDLGPVGVPQVVEQVAPGHKLSDNVERRLPGAHSQQLHQIGVFHLLQPGTLQETLCELIQEAMSIHFMLSTKIFH